ncbi:MAG: Lrp/AsnC family transcriptional regulator, partial [Thermococcus sp.]
MPGIDEKDREILRILRSNGRITLTELGKRVNLSPASVKSRLEKLERLGAVKGYSAVIDPAFLGDFIRALVFLHFEHFDEGIRPMVKGLKYLDNVEFLYIKTGDSQVLIKATFKDIEELEDFLKSLKRKFGKSLKFIEANLVVEELKNCWLADEDAS